jgi:mannose-binding lectin 2
MFQARGLRGASVPTKARITYFQDKYLALDLQYKTENEWISCFTVHHDKGHSINIPPVAYLGFTAETGELHDNHEIISVKAYSLYNQRSNRGDHPSPIDDKHNTPGHQENANPKLDDHHIKKRGTWMGFFFKTFMFLGLLGGVYIAFTMYRASRRGRF